MKKTILITGSTDGIGKLAAELLAKEGHQVILHGRDADKLVAVKTEMGKLAPEATLGGFVADLSDLRSVRNMAAEITKSVDKIDVLINNAGVYKSVNATNKHGLDLRFVVNYLAPVVLTNALLPLLRRGSEPRIINLSSAAQAPVSLEALQGTRTLSESESYAQSKLALTMWSFHLAHEHPDITTIAVNPGSLLNTRMVREAFGKHWSPADKGAKILYELAVADEHHGMSGMYYDNDAGGYGKAHADAYDPSAIADLIRTTEGLSK